MVIGIHSGEKRYVETLCSVCLKCEKDESYSVGNCTVCRTRLKILHNLQLAKTSQRVLLDKPCTVYRTKLDQFPYLQYMHIIYLTILKIIWYLCRISLSCFLVAASNAAFRNFPKRFGGGLQFLSVSAMKWPEIAALTQCCTDTSVWFQIHI